MAALVPQIDFYGMLSGIGQSYQQGLGRYYDDQAARALSGWWDSRGAAAQQPAGLSGLGLGSQPAVYSAPLPAPGQASTPTAAPAATPAGPSNTLTLAAPQAAQNPFGNAISSIESGGRYDLVGPVANQSGDRAFGKYQVMGSNVGPWTREVLGREMTPQEFLASPEAQEAVFNAKFGSYVQKYGPEGAARAWFAGEGGMNNPNARDVLGTTVAGYADKFNRNLAQAGGAAGAAPMSFGAPPNPATAQGRIPGDLLATLMRSKAYRSVGEALLREGIRPAGGQWTTYQLPDGSVWQRDSQTGKIDVVQRGASAQQNEFGLNPVYGVDAEGNPVIMQVGKSGQAIQTRLPEGVRLSKEPIRIDAGTHTVLLDPVTRQQIGTVPKNIATSEQQKVVGRAAGETQANAPKAAATLRDLEMQWQTVNRSIDDALSGIDWSTVGFVGDLTKAVPGSPAYNLARILETIQANIGFDKLQSLRDNSPTGGALGQVSDSENRLLQTVRGSLAQGQSSEQLRRNLMQIQTDLRAVQQERRRAFQQTYGQLPESVGSGVGGAAPGGGSRGTVNAVPQAAIDYLRANPQYREQFDQKYGAGSAAQVLGQ